MELTALQRFNSFYRSELRAQQSARRRRSASDDATARGRPLARGDSLSSTSSEGSLAALGLAGYAESPPSLLELPPGNAALPTRAPIAPPRRGQRERDAAEQERFVRRERHASAAEEAARRAEAALAETRWQKLPSLAKLQTGRDVAWYTVDGIAKGFLAGFLGRSVFTLLPALIRSVGNALSGAQQGSSGGAVAAAAVAGAAAAAASAASATSASSGSSSGRGLAAALRTVVAALRSAAARDVKTAGTVGLFVGACAGVLRATVASVSVRLRSAQDSRIPAQTVRSSCAVAGALLGASMMLLPGGGKADIRNPIALFFFVRALEVSVRWLAERRLVPTIPHADTLLMMGASAQVCWAWVFQPDILSPSYLRFMNYHGGRPRQMVDAVAAIHRPPYDTADISHIEAFYKPLLEAASAAAVAAGTPELAPRPFNRHAPSHALSCEIVHPGGVSCMGHFAEFLVGGIQRAVKVYVPVYLIPVLTLGLSRLRENPTKSVMSTLFGIGRSSLFLASYCGQAWLAVCTMRQFFGVRNGYANGYAAGLAGGAAVLYEKKPRRIELGLYVLSQALDSVRRMARRDGWSRFLWPVPGVDGSCALFGASMAVILNAFLASPQLMRPGYRRIVRFAL